MNFDLFKPRAGRLLIHIHALPNGEPVMVNGVYVAPRKRSSYGIIATVLRVADDIDDLKPGDDILIPEFAGLPIYDGEVESAYFIIGIGDVLGVLDAPDEG